MARAKKTPAIEETVISVEAVDSDTREDIRRALAELDAEADKLGHIGHLYYAKKVGERLRVISDTLKTLL